MSLVNVTESAKEQMIKLVNENDTDAVHLSVKGGGCSGFMYEWGFVKENEINTVSYTHLTLPTNREV